MISLAKSGSNRDKILGVLLCAWLALVFSHYFSLKSVSDLSFLAPLHEAVSQADLHKLLLNWFQFLKTLFCGLSALFVLWRCGRKISTRIGLENTNAVLRFCLEMALGIIGANAFWLGLGFNGLWSGPLVWGIALGLLGWALWDAYRGFLKIQKFPRLVFPKKFFLWMGALAFLFWVLSLLQAVAPDIYFDALVYHLSTLQFWKFHHGIADFYTNLYSYFPFGGELYFLNGFYFGGSEAAKLLNVFSAGLLALAVGGWVAEEKRADLGWLSGTMVMVIPLVSTTVWTTQNDVLLAFFLILFFYAVSHWLQSFKGSSWAFLAGLLGGAALTVKYTAVVGLAAGLLALVFGFGKEVFSPKKRVGWVWIVLLALISFSPWFLKNSIFTGNGFYPYGSSFFGGRALPPENLNRLLADQKGILSDFASTGGWVRQVFSRDLDKTIAPLLFGFLPFLFWRRQKNPLAGYLLVLSVLYLVLGFSISHQPRLMIPAFAGCFTAMGMVLGDIGKKFLTYGWAWAVVLFGVLSLFSLSRLNTSYYQPQKMWAGVETREEYLAHSPQTESYYGLVQDAALLPSNARLLVVGDARSLYYPLPFLANSVFDEPVLSKLARQEKDSTAIRKRLREMGVDAIALSWEEAKRLGQYPFTPVGLDEEESKLAELFGDFYIISGSSQGVLFLKKWNPQKERPFTHP